MIHRTLLFRALQADFVGSTVLCFVDYRSTHCFISAFLPVGRPFAWDEPAQYISMRASEMTRVIPTRE